MPDYTWPAPKDRDQLGARLTRIDGPIKVTGSAGYPSDVNRRGMLFARILHCPHAHAKITRIDVSAAEAMPDAAEHDWEEIHPRPAAEGDQATLECQIRDAVAQFTSRFACGFILDEVDADHQTDAAHITDAGVACLNFS